MQTYKDAINLQTALEEASQKGTLDFKILVFKNIKVLEEVTAPIIKSKKVIDKMLEEHNESVNKIVSEFGSDYGTGRLLVLPYLLQSNGEPDLTRPNPKYAPFTAALEVLKEKNKSLIESHKTQVKAFNELLDKDLEVTLTFIKIPTDKVPRKENGDCDINAIPLLEFNIIELDSKEPNSNSK